MQLFGGIRQEMQQGNAQHEAGHQADGDLQARMSGPDDQQQPAAGQRSQQHQQAINGQQAVGRNNGSPYGSVCKFFPA